MHFEKEYESSSIALLLLTYNRFRITRNVCISLDRIETARCVKKMNTLCNKVYTKRYHSFRLRTYTRPQHFQYLQSTFKKPRSTLVSITDTGSFVHARVPHKIQVQQSEVNTTEIYPMTEALPKPTFSIESNVSSQEL